MRIRTLALTALFAVTLGLAGCSVGGDPWQDRPGPKVLAFFPPLYSLAAQVAGDDAQVQSLLTSKGPHDYEPRPADAQRLRRADLFVVNGLGLDEVLAKRLATSANNPKLKLVEVGESVPEDKLFEAGACSCKHDHEGADHKHEHGAHDPHVWLGIPEAVHMATAIRDALSEVDPSHADGYAKRTAALTERLHKLQADGRKALAGKDARMLTHHDALRYFARSFGAEVVDAIEMPGREPSGQRLAELVKLCTEKKVRLIAVEPQYPSHTGAQTILKELKRNKIDAAFVEIDTLETADPAELTPDFYERKMRSNLDNLAGAVK
jgi:ABC-type Zn uptake system ZnuABC Zn-binding protein ZnuA